MKIQKLKTSSNKKGFALVTVLVIILLLFLIASIFVTTAVFEARIARNQTIDTKTFFVAEAGYNHALQQIKTYPGLIPSGTVVEGTIDGIIYNSEIRLISDPNDPVKIYEIITYVYDPITGVRKKIIVTIRIQTFSKYAYYTNQEKSVTGRTVWFVGIPQLKDVLGKKAWVSPDEPSDATLHTNTQFSFYGSPEFWAKVESVSQTAKFYDVIERTIYVLDADKHEPGAVPLFKKGFNRGVDNIPFPENINSVDAAAPSRTINISGGVIELSGSTATINGTPYDITNIDVIKATGNIDVSGVLDGRITIATTGKIFVVDNLTYANQSPSSDDILGLFAENDIVVKNDEDIAPGVGKDITIDASIVSLTKFTIYPFSGGTWDNPYGRRPGATLHVNGGIVQNVRGIMGHFSLSRGILDGYLKDYRYDNRLLETPPPFFPTTGEPEIISWREEIIK